MKTIDKTFLLAGKARFTVEPPAAWCTEKDAPAHWTFQVKHKEANGPYPEAWFVSLLTGPNNEDDYSYLGKLYPATAAVKLTAASKVSEDSLVLKVLRRVVANLLAGTEAAITGAGWKVHHAGYCGRCGRTLTVPSSVESGYGPECVKLIGL